MRWFPPQAAACVLALACATSLGGCGRLGFDSQRSNVSDGSDASDDPGAPDAGRFEGPGDGDSDGPGDGDGPGDDASVNPQVPDAGDDSPAPGHDDAGLPPDDAGGAAPDASTPPEPDAGSEPGPDPEPYPLPTAVDCAPLGGVLACSNLAGSTRGASVYTDQESATISAHEGYVTATAQNLNARAVLQADIPARTSGPIYLRFSLYLPSDISVHGLNIANIGIPGTAGDFGLDLNLEREGEVEVYTTGDDAVVVAPGYVVPRDRWMCVLLKVEDIHDTDSTVRVRIDGQDVLTATSLDTLPPGGVVGASAGIDWTYDAQSETRLHVGNFLLTSQHPGDCP